MDNIIFNAIIHLPKKEFYVVTLEVTFMNTH